MVEIKECLKVCVTGCEKQSDEKAIVKWFRKMFAAELTDGKLPIKAVAKKRGNTFCFLSF
jgi:hypothetical protein